MGTAGRNYVYTPFLLSDGWLGCMGVVRWKTQLISCIVHVKQNHVNEVLHLDNSRLEICLSMHAT